MVDFPPYTTLCFCRVRCVGMGDTLSRAWSPNLCRSEAPPHPQAWAYLQRLGDPGLGGLVHLGLSHTPTAGLAQVAQAEAEVFLVCVFLDLGEPQSVPLHWGSRSLPTSLHLGVPKPATPLSRCPGVTRPLNEVRICQSVAGGRVGWSLGGWGIRRISMFAGHQGVPFPTGTDLPKAHAVGLFADLRQPQALLHLPVPGRAGHSAGKGVHCLSCSPHCARLAVVSPPSHPTLPPYLRPPRFLRCPSRGAGSGFTCFTGGGSCHLSNLRSISSFSS